MNRTNVGEAVMVQKCWWGATQTYKLPGNGTLEISQRCGGTRSHVIVELSQLLVPPLRHKIVQHAMLYAFIVFGLLALLLIVLVIAVATNNDDRIVWGSMAAFLMLPTVLCLYGYLSQRQDVHIFSNHLGRPALFFQYGKPNAEVYANFLARLAGEIQKAQVTIKVHDADIATELVGLGQLNAKGVLTDAEFRMAKEKVISSQKTCNPIGFTTGS